MSGGTWERTASYINNGKTGNGASVVVGKEKKYKICNSISIFRYRSK